MGQKVNPIGLRLGIHRKWNSSWYFDFNNYSKFIYMNFNIEKFFRGFLHYYPKKTLLVKCQIIKLPSNKLYIFIFFYKFRLKNKKKFFNKTYNKEVKYSLKDSSLNNEFKWYNTNNFIKNNFDFDDLILEKKSFSNINSTSNIELQKILEYKQNNLFNLINITKDLNKLKKINSNNKWKYNKSFFNKNYKQYNLKKQILVNNFKILNNLYNLIILKNKISTLKNSLSQDNNLDKIKKNINYKIIITTKKIDLLNNLNNTICTKLNNKYLDFIINNNFIINNTDYYNKVLNKKLNLNKTKNNQTFKNFVNNKKYNKYNIENKLKIKSPNFYLKLKNIKKFISKFTNSKVSIFFINALSFSKFYYRLSQENEKLKKNLNTIKNIENQMVNRYRYDTIYINDLVNIAFISILLKNPQFLTQFIAFQFKKLPKNKKQMKLIQLITQVIQTIITERDEVIGLKLRFKGRINKRKRARTITINQGVMALQSDSTRVEYGYSEGYTKSGLIGIKLWVFYKKTFKNKLKNNFLQYIEYSKLKNKNNFIC
mgnify:CR=1 FL=1